jgi:hypothetical protein
LEATARGGPDLQRPIVGRGLAVGDYDNDGRVDVLVSDLEGAPLLLHNRASPLHHWLCFRLEAAPGRSAEGAEVIVRSGSRRWFRRATTGGSYLSASDPRVYVGLGALSRVAQVEIRWPGGARQRIAAPVLDGETRIRQPAGGRDLKIAAAPAGK